MVDVAADSGWLITTLNIIQLYQMVIQGPYPLLHRFRNSLYHFDKRERNPLGRWNTDSTLLQLPRFSQKFVDLCARQGIHYLPQIAGLVPKKMETLLTKVSLSLFRHCDDLMSSFRS